VADSSFSCELGMTTDVTDFNTIVDGLARSCVFMAARSIVERIEVVKERRGEHEGVAVH